MAYITKSNAQKIIKKLEEAKLDAVAEAIYKKDIPFFSKRESANLKGIRELFRDLDKFVKVYYKPITVEDSFRYVFAENQPAYHKDETCERLNANFKNTEVPKAIYEKGHLEIIQFRDWYVNTTFESPKDYIEKLQLKFPYVGVIHPKTVEYENSKPELKTNYSLQQLENEIEDILNKADTYFNDNPPIRSLIYKYQKLSFLGYIPGSLKNNHSGLDDENLKGFLQAYEETFKTPIKMRLVEYYRLLFNPDMEFEGRLLDKMGFRPCNSCIVKR